MELKSILNWLRFAVVLLSVSTVFAVSTYCRQNESSIDTKTINSKLDQIIEESRARETVIFRTLMEMQQTKSSREHIAVF